jgi:hypothetical protein
MVRVLGFPFFPILMAAYPILGLVAKNADQLHVSSMWRPLFFVEGITVAIWLLGALAYRSTHAGAVVAAVVMVVGSAYKITVDSIPLPHWASNAAVGLLVVMVLVAAPALQRKPAWTPTLNAFALILILMPISILALAVATAMPPTPVPPLEINWTASEAFSTGPEARPRRPDIYVIIPDGYGSAATLERVFDWDSQPFLDSLKALGFSISPEANSNYSQTQLSLSSFLNMDYLSAWDLKVDSSSDDRRPLRELIRHNRVSRILQEKNYEILAFQSGYPAAEMRTADRFLKEPGLPSFLEMVALEFSAVPQGIAAAVFWDPFEIHRRRVLFAFRELSAQASDPGPKLVFSHILSPHPPFVFDNLGRKVRPDGLYQTGDGNHFHEGSDEYRRGYRAQTQFISDQILQTVTRLLLESQEPPIIIVQGDHGPGAFLDQGGPEQTDIHERMGILSAIYLPEVGAHLSPQDASPVNVFRFIFRTFFGADLPPLEVRNYFTAWDTPYAFLDVTGQLRDEPKPHPDFR